MRAVFVGSSGTGKTTMAKLMAEAYGLPMTPVGSRSTAKAMGFDNPYDVDRASLSRYLHGELELHPSNSLTVEDVAQRSMVNVVGGEITVRRLFQQRIQDAKIAWETDNSEFISDRSTIDDLVYSMMHCPEAVTHEFIMKCKRHLAGYSHVIMAPMEAFHDVGADTTRISGIDYHRKFQEFAFAFVTAWVPPSKIMVLGPGDPKTRWDSMIAEFYNRRPR